MVNCANNIILIVISAVSRIALTHRTRNKISRCTKWLSKVVIRNSDKPIWNNEWLISELAENLPCDSIINKETLKNVTPVITFRETRTYNEQFY